MTVETLPASPRAIGRRVPVPTEVPWTLELLGPPRFAITVYGDPAPQGSKNAYVRGGRAIMYEASAKRQKPWRQAVTAAAVAALPHDWEPLDGPLIIDHVYSVKKGTTLPRWLAWAGTGDDSDKLARATNDALTDAGVWVDDSRVMDYRRGPAKVYGGCGDPDALGPSQTGAVLRVWTLPQSLIDARKAFVRAKAPA
jgi:Holliday junction resolvase RusA-like endonuclease